MIKIIEDYGGIVEKNTGDGLMAYFAADSTFSHHQSQRACAAAMTIFYSSATMLNPVIIRSNIAPLDFRICIDHGNITVANVGAAQRFRSFVAIGTTANIACKLLKLAQKNQIIVGADVLLGLPEAWRSIHCKMVQESTGFVYAETQLPYLAYHFDAKWNGLRDDR